MRCALLALALLSLVSPTFADSKLDRLDRSYPYGEGRVTLDHNSHAIAVLLRTDVEDEFEAVAQLAAETAALATPERDDRQGYERLWFLRLERALSVVEYGALLDALSADPRTRFAAPIFGYDNSVMVPKPELLLAFTREDEATRRALEEELGLTLIRTLPGLGTTYHYQTRVAARDLLRLSCELIERPEIARVEPNFITQLPRLSAPNDPLFNTQWAHENTGQTGGTVGADMKSVSAWDVTTGSSSIVIAIIDEGVDMDHEDLAASIVGGHDSTDQPWPEGVEGNALPNNGHGTSCAGIAAAIGNNGIGIAGVSQSASILAVRIGYADHWTEDAWIIDAITWSTDNGADVLSNSWGGGAPSAAEQNAMQYAKTTGRGGLGCPILFASGNDNSLVDYPGKYPETMAIGASSPCDERKNPSSCDGETWWGSNFGPELTLVTPGVLIQTTDIMGADGYAAGNYVADFNGTSSACPQAAGAAALLLTLLPGLTADEVQTYLEQSCDDEVGPPAEDTPGWDQYMGHGRLNLTTLMTLAGAPALPQNLACTDVSADAQLTWTNPQSYDQIVVQRDGVDIAAISGTATSYVDLAPGIGTRTYGVRGVVGSLHGPSAMCSLFLSGGATDLVWQPSDAGGPVDGGQGLLDALVANGRTAVLVDDLSVVADLNDFDRVWVNLGIYPDNHVLTAGEGSLLETYLNDGIGGSALYLEGGDTWAFDTATTLHPLFEINGVADGTGDYSFAIGTGATSCDLTGVDLAYGGENAWIDQLAPAGAAWTIQQNDTPSYDSAVFNDATSYRTIGASHEFAGLVDGASTRADLMASYLDCLGAGTVPNPVTALTCGESGDDVLITWSNGDVYSTIDVMRNGGVLATVSGTATSYVDLAPPGGSHTYSVIGYDVNTPSNPADCSTNVTPNTPGGLSCSVTPTQVDLAWSNAESYSSIEVRRGGAVIATIAGSATSFSDVSPVSGPQLYEVIGEIGALSSAPASCSADYVTPPSVTGITPYAEDCNGGSVTLTVTATGDALTYQWRKAGANVSGATASSLTLTPLVATDAADYDCVVSNSAGSETSGTATVVVLEPPVLTQNPADASNCPGAAVTFTVAANGDGLAYQWRKNGANVSGAVSAMLTLASITAGDAGSYDCVVTGTCGSATSNAATLTVLAPPAITQQPSGATECPGGSATLTVAATGAGLSYQWRKDGASVAGATSASLTLASLSAADAGNYDCVVTGTCGSATSAAASIVVLTATSITAQPASATECPGDSVTFSVAATGSSLSYQWRKDGASIAGAINPSFSIAAVGIGDAGSYDCVVTGTCGSATSSAATLTVLTATAITASPASATECPGAAVTLSVSANGSALSYQWRKDGAPIAGATASTLTLASLIAADAGSYDCVVTGDCGSETSAAATVTVLTPVSISGQPSGATVCPGDALTFSVAASGSGLAYQWRKDGASIAGAINASYSIAAATSGDAGSYDCVVTSTCGSATSSAATLTVLTTTAITASPTSTTECSGASVTLSVSAAGSALTYQWRKDGSNVAGATGATLTFASLLAADAGSYDCVVTGDCGSETSAAATVTVLAPVSISGQPSGATVCPGDAVTFTVTASGDGLSYQWRKDGASIGGATGASLTLAAASAADAGSYDCVVTGSCGSAASNAAILAVLEAPSITAQPVSVTECPDASVTFTVGASGDGLSYQWRKDGAALGGANSASLLLASVSAADTGNYDCVVTGTCGSVTSGAASLTVLPAPVITSNPTSTDACPGATTTFSVTANGAGLDYQWRKNGIALSGATGASYTIASVGPVDAGSYDCVVTGDCGIATSGAATLTVFQEPVISADPSGSTECPGGSITFAITASGEGLTYQWRQDGASIPGATGASYTVASIDAADAGSYDCVVSGTCGTATSAAATLTVLEVPSIAANPASQTAPVSSDVTFTVTATGSAPLSYQWHFGGTPIAGATAASLTVSGVTSGDAGAYHVVVSNGCDSATSADAILTISAVPAVTDVTACASDDTVEVCWTNAGSYDAITVLRDGSAIATLGGSETCYTDSGVATGAHTYGVVATILTDSSGATEAATTVLANIAGLTCEIENPTFVTPDVALAWTNPGGYDTVTVLRDGAAIATLDGAATSHVDVGVTPGTRVYQVVGTLSAADCPSLTSGLECTAEVPGPATFRRGDANSDSSVNVADVIFILAWIFTSGEDPQCFDAGDTNDDGTLDLADAIYLLNYTFVDGPEPPAPFTEAGVDPTDDALDCATSTP